VISQTFLAQNSSARAFVVLKLPVKDSLCKRGSRDEIQVKERTMESRIRQQIAMRLKSKVLWQRLDPLISWINKFSMQATS